MNDTLLEGAVVEIADRVIRSGKAHPRLPCDDSSVPSEEGSPAVDDPATDGRAVAAIRAHDFGE